MRNHTLSTPTAANRRPSPQLISDGVVAGYIHEISERHGARVRLTPRPRTVPVRAPRRPARSRVVEVLGV